MATAATLLGALAGGVGVVGEAQALTACTAANVNSQDSGCPSGTGACNITKVFDVGDGCTLDFGARNVTVTNSGRLNIHSGAVTLKGANITIANGSLIDGKSTTSTPPTNRGGMITFQASGTFSVLRVSGVNGIIDVSGFAQGGTVIINAGGSVSLAGKILAPQLDPTGSGGSVSIRTGGDFIMSTNAVLTATGGITGGGGSVDVVAAGRIDLGDTVLLNGGDGGLLDLLAGADIVMRRVEAIGQGDAGSGGCVSATAGTRVQMLDQVLGNGTASSTGSGGGCGGFLDVEAQYGDITVSNNLLFDSGDPDGGGGGITLTSRGSINIGAAADVAVNGTGASSCGGEISLDAGLDVFSSGTLDASGGFGGNLIDITSGRNTTLIGRVDAQGRSLGSFGGTVTIATGTQGPGTLQINNVLTVDGGGCDVALGCGVGGFSDISACDLTVNSTANLSARGAEGGQMTLTAREQLRVLGPINSTTVGGGNDGTNAFIHKNTKPPIVSGVVTPAAVLTPLPACTGPTGVCLTPCPTCGNGVVEFPETCDTSGTPVSCDGCSIFCQTENCNDGSVCTTDSCDPTLGCRHTPAPDGTSCSDGNVCNGVETCTFGFCLATAPLNCSDSNPCTLDPCNPTTGCGSHPPAPAGTPCNDNNLCTLGDACNATGGCVPGTTSLTCNDNLECTNDSCSPTAGCVFTSRTGACTDDGNECTTDVCSGGLCTHPARTGTCTDDGNVCTSDVCSGTACTHPNRANGTACDDGGYCTVNDSCQGGVCTGGGARNCGDTDSCTADSCDEISDTCVHTPVTPCCGNGVPETGEACDDGNTSNNDACLNTCAAATCGDGFLRTGVEQCDLGAANSDGPNANCRTDCRPQRCGDGILDTLRGEQCDDGNNAAGDGCSPTCSFEPPPSGDRIPGKGSALTDCALEWAMDNPALDRKGIPSIKQSCSDGDPACDFGTTSGECTFHVWLCANNNDARLPLCTTGGPGVGLVFRVDALKPNTRDVGLRPEDAANRQELLQAAAAAQVSTFDTCGPRMNIRVPLKDPTRKGVKAIRVKGFTNVGIKDADVLKLFCLP